MSAWNWSLFLLVQLLGRKRRDHDKKLSLISFRIREARSDRIEGVFTSRRERGFKFISLLPLLTAIDFSNNDRLLNKTSIPGYFVYYLLRDHLLFIFSPILLFLSPSLSMSIFELQLTFEVFKRMMIIIDERSVPVFFLSSSGNVAFPHSKNSILGTLTWINSHNSWFCEKKSFVTVIVSNEEYHIISLAEISSNFFRWKINSNLLSE